MTIPEAAAWRSLLFVPGNRPDMVAKVGRSRPDVVALDLEDAVAPEGKGDARATVAATLAERRPDAGLVLVRVNATDTEWYDDDVATAARAAAAGALDGVVLPKYETSAQLAALRDALPAGARVVAGLESALGLADARPLLAAGPDAVYLGAEDLVAELGGRRTAAGHEVAWARAAVRVAAHLGGVAALDQAVVAVHDEDAFRADAGTARDLGYHGKICLHPRQVALAHEVFTPSPEELAHARAVLDGVGEGVGVVDGQMVDAVHVRMARDVLARAGEG